MHLLLDNKNILDLIAKTLIEKEKITGIEMLDLIK
jgi:ATP-dependent Zn protease